MSRTPRTGLIRESFPVGPLQCNCTILGDAASGKALVVDPGDDADEILRRLEAHGLKAVALVHTHAHFDHVGATRRVAEATQAAIRLHEADLFLYENLDMQGAAFGFEFDAVLPVSEYVRDGDTVAAGGVEVEVVHTPGHTPGSVCFSLAGAAPILFSGDTLFQRSIGRTDLWGGDIRAIERSIRTRLYALPPETVVIPGHGPETTIGEERKLNPFVRA
jgi:glyoxylase-like metal-dependent hydrolase (beta-lactamase superfamily II)